MSTHSRDIIDIVLIETRRRSESRQIHIDKN